MNRHISGSLLQTFTELVGRDEWTARKAKILRALTEMGRPKKQFFLRVDLYYVKALNRLHVGVLFAQAQK